MTWLLLTGAGLVAETVVIVVLGRTVTARHDPGEELPAPVHPIVRGSGRGIRLGLFADDPRTPRSGETKSQDANL